MALRAMFFGHLAVFALLAGWAISGAQSQPNPTTVSSAWSGNEGFTLSFPSETGYLYTLEYRDNLEAGSIWQEIDAFREVPGTGESMLFTDTASAGSDIARRLYRLRIDLPPSSPGGESAILALYEFTDEDPAPQTVHPAVTATDFAISAASLIMGTADADTWTGSGVPYAQGNTGWGTTSASAAKHFTYTITAQEGDAFSITNVRFLARATAAGPSAIGIMINDNEVYEQDMPDGQTIVVSVPVSGYNSLTQAVIRIPGWANGSRSTGGGGHFRIDDVQTEGVVGVAADPEPPTVNAPSVAGVSDATATLGGTIVDGGGVTVTERGIYWSTTQGFTPPSQGTPVSETGAFGEGAFTVHVSSMPPDTTIYYRAFAANSVGMGLSAEASFTTALLPVLQVPEVLDPLAMDITETTALMGGTITNDGGGILVERGVYWSLTPDFDPVEEGHKAFESGEFEIGSFLLRVENLPGDTEIFFRAFAANAEEVGYSELYSFTTPADDDLAFYSFTGHTAEPQSHRETIEATPLTVSTGSFSFAWASGQASAWNNLGGANPYVQSSGGWTAPNQSDAKHFLVALSTDSGWLMTITNISYLARSTPQGPSAVGIALNGDAIHEADIQANIVTLVQSLVTGYTDVTQAVIRIQGWDNGSRNTSGGGDMQIDNILVQGSMSMAADVSAPVVTSPSASNIAAYSVTLGGTISDTGGSTITERGVYWSTVADFPLGAGTKVSETGSFGAGVFSVTASQLPADSVIYFRAFAKNAGFTAYSDQLSFNTAPLEPALLSLYEFTDAEVTPHAVHPNITSSHLVQNNGRPGIASLNAWAWTGSGVPYAQLSGSLAQTDVNNARHFIYAIEARAGTTFDITNITFLARATTQGPSAISVSIDGDVIHTQDMPDSDVVSVHVPVTGYDGLSLSRIRILGWDNGSRNTTGGGALQIDDVRTEGAVAGTVMTPVTEGQLVRVVSINLENGIGEFGSDKYLAQKAILERIGADVVAFQEVYANETQSNRWANLAVALGYDHWALAPPGDLDGGHRCGYYSRFPITSTHAVLSTPPASEMTRAVFRAVIQVPGADNPLVIWNAHKKAMGDEVSQFRRAIETLRVVQDIDAYRAAHTGHVEFIVLGDLNADFFTQAQTASFSETWYAENAAAFPGAFELGNDISFPVQYAWYPDDRYAQSEHGLYRPIITQADGKGIYSFLNNSFISRLDYFYVSEALAVKQPAGEIYHSKHDGAFPGLPKAGDPLPADTSWTSSDHLPVFIDIHMSDALTASEFAATATRFSDDTPTRDEDGTTISTTTVTVDDDDETPIESEFAPRRTIRTLTEVAEVTRLEIIPLTHGQVELRFPTDIGFLYSIEHVSGVGNGVTWNVLHGHEHIEGTGGPVSRVDDRPVSDGVVRFYRVRVEEAP